MSFEPTNPLRRESGPRLRLVRDGSPVRAVANRADRVAKENRAASNLTDDDARAILALRVSEQLQGGRSAVLTPERRRGLVTTAQVLGLRPFDASLIIAVVQDAARRGEGIDHPQTTGRLGMVGGAPKGAPNESARHREFLIAIVASVVMACALMVVVIRWIAGA